ncbi:MAG: DoxX family protein [Bacteroidota bacterium]|nr:DoxX family protein [Bacteroidota bacterium]
MIKKNLLTSRGAWSNGIFIARIFSAIMLLPYGLELFSDHKMNDLTRFPGDAKVPLPVPIGYLARITEFSGSTLLAAGLFTRIITVPVMISMAVVIYLTGNGNIFNTETPFLFLLLFFIFFLNDPGKWSLDYFLFDGKKIKN